MVSSSFSEKKEDHGRIVPVDSGRRLRTEIIFPPKEKLPSGLLKTHGFFGGLTENYFVSEGNLKKEIIGMFMVSWLLTAGSDSHQRRVIL